MNTTDKQTQTNQPDAEVGRRSLLSTAAVAAAGIAAVGLLKPSRSFGVTPALTFADIPGTGDIQVLNFALALEDLEADLYTQANQRFTGGGKNALGIYIPGLHMGDGTAAVAYTYQFSVVEARHRDFLRDALGSAAIPAYKYDFGMQSLSEEQVLNLLYTAEALGTAAYLGAIPYLSSKTYLQIAGSIQGTEARHTAALASIINSMYNEGLLTAPVTKQYGGNNGIEVPIPPNTVLKTVSPYIVV
jgi:hypothetical protein